MPTQRYKTNLQCGKCVAKVAPYLDGDARISQWDVNTDSPNKILKIVGDAADDDIRQHLSDAGFELLGQIESDDAAPTPSFLTTYRPLLLVLAYLLGMVAIVEIVIGEFVWMRASANFMGGFFVAFSFFKMLDVRGFADSFQTYDVLAARVRAYAFAYPFVELALGVAYLMNWQPIVTNAVTLAVMLLGIVGVTEALMNKRRIQCACLGTVFNLPMSKVTFIEDGAMAAMAAAMLIGIFVV